MNQQYKPTYEDITSKESVELIEPFEKAMLKVLNEEHNAVKDVSVTSISPGSVKVSFESPFWCNTTELIKFLREKKLWSAEAEISFFCLHIFMLAICWSIFTLAILQSIFMLAIPELPKMN